MRKTRPVEERFWEKVQKRPGNGCWEWSASLHRDGYGWFWDPVKHQMVLAHRMSWQLSFGLLPQSLCVLHKCDNPRCVRPDHLFLGTQKDNVRDMAHKSRAPNLKGQRNGRAKLTDSEVRQIRETYRQGGITQKELVGRFQSSPSRVSAIVRGMSWKHVA